MLVLQSQVVVSSHYACYVAMRSPKSTSNSFFPESTDPRRTSHASDEQRKLRLAALRSVPMNVARDIIQHEPADSYRNVQLERDRRLRLYIRRYVNQIQYGCHNRNCTTTTCLSYRRRHSKTPVRQYTDTSARALACHLVDEASRNRQDPALGFCPNQPVVPWYQDPRTTKDRRDRVSATPSRQPRHVPNGFTHGPQEKRLSTTSHPVNATPIPSTKDSEEIKGKSAASQSTSSLTGEVSSQPPSRRASRSASAQQPDHSPRLSSATQERVDPPVQRHGPTTRRPVRHNEEIIAHREVDGRIRYLVVWREGVDAKMAWSTEGTIHDRNVLVLYKKEHGPADALDGDQLANLEAALEVMPITMIEDQMEDLLEEQTAKQDSLEAASTPRIDFASFTQTLWNTLTLRTLETRKEQPKKDEHPEYDDCDIDVEDIEGEQKICANEIDVKEESLLSNTAFQGFTLRRLSWDSLGFLMDATKKKSSVRGSPFETFIKQSIHHNLGNPSRLLTTVDHWHWEEAENSEDDSASEASESPKNASRRASGSSRLKGQVWKDDERIHQVDSAETIMTAFQSIESILDGTDILFQALYGALQQCYEVDHPAYGGSKEAKVARQAFRGTGGGLYDPSRQAALTRSYSIQQTGQLPTRTQVSRIFFLTLIALVTPLYSYRWAKQGFDSIGFITIADLRGDNKAGFSTHGRTQAARTESKTLQVLTEVLDHLDDWHRCRLASALTDCISHHVAAAEVRRIKSHPRTKPRNVINDAFSILQRDFEQPLRSGDRSDAKFRLMLAMGIVDVARTVLLKDWDRSPIVARTGSVGGALELLSAMYHRFDTFGLGESAHLFEMPFIAAAFDEMELPNDWLDFRSNNHQYHVLSYPFLFETSTLVKYFRAINITAMKVSFETASMVYTDAYTYLQSHQIPVYGGRDIDQVMRPYMAKYLVLTVRRTNLLEDAINQLWRRQRREILRPLRVLLGSHEGEDGIDYGGVQQEFFRLAFAEAFNPDHGMFTVDERTKMTWFQPGSQEPLWHFEAIGVLMGIAVYNCINLPINMPLAFYRKLLGFKVNKLEHIQDGWPDLEKGLRQLLEYDGDVTEDIGRTYEFSYEFGGRNFTKDISSNSRFRHTASPPPVLSSKKGKEKARSPSFELPAAVDPPPVQHLSASNSPDMDTGISDTSSPIPAIDSGVSISTPLSTPSPSLAPASPSISPQSSHESPPVTNATRERYVKDYITHLTHHSIAPQFDAFLRGVHAALHPQALHLFTPVQLRDLIEGHRHIDIDELEQHATYEEFHDSDPYLKGFWEVVREEAAKDETWTGQLLEFVLASARVPVGGWGSAGTGQGRGSFVVQKNGDEWIDENSLNTIGAQNDVPVEEGAGAPEEAVPASAAPIPAVTVAIEDAGGPGLPAAVGAAAADDDDDISEASATAQTSGEHVAVQGRSVYRARLPSSSTCYARLLLPRYHVVGEDELGATGSEPGRRWKEVLRERLRKAVAEGRGFGML